MFNDNVITAAIREAAMMLARLWVQYVRPVAYERVFYIDNVRVKVSISEYKTADDTQPVRRAVDEDDRISD